MLEKQQCCLQLLIQHVGNYYYIRSRECVFFRDSAVDEGVSLNEDAEGKERDNQGPCDLAQSHFGFSLSEDIKVQATEHQTLIQNFFGKIL